MVIASKKKLILDNHGKIVPVHKNMTSHLDPLDLTVHPKFFSKTER